MALDAGGCGRASSGVNPLLDSRQEPFDLACALLCTRKFPWHRSPESDLRGREPLRCGRLISVKHLGCADPKAGQPFSGIRPGDRSHRGWRNSHGSRWLSERTRSFAIPGVSGQPKPTALGFFAPRLLLQSSKTRGAHSQSVGLKSLTFIQRKLRSHHWKSRHPARPFRF
jgi:hypothetical protein